MNNPKQEADRVITMFMGVDVKKLTSADMEAMNQYLEAHTTKLLNEQLTRLEEQGMQALFQFDDMEYANGTYIPLSAIEKEREKL